MTEQEFRNEFYRRIAEIQNVNPGRYRHIEISSREFYPGQDGDSGQALRDLVSLWREEATEYSDE